MGAIQPVDSLSGVSDYPINFFHLTEAFLGQVHNAFKFTAKAKTKAEVEATGAKWFRQKGTGRARQGEQTNPHMKGGGKAHGPRPRYAPVKVNKRIKHSAWLSALKYHLDRKTLYAIPTAETSGFEKTRQVVSLLNDAGIFGRVLICCARGSLLERSARNIADIAVLEPERLNVRDMMLAEHLLFTSDALSQAERMASAIVCDGKAVRRSRMHGADEFAEGESSGGDSNDKKEAGNE